MKRRNFFLVLLITVSSVSSAKMRFLDADFAKKACEGWNQSNLPDHFKREKSSFIDSRGGNGKQDCVMHRRDCKDQKRIVLKLRLDEKERATCAEADWYSGTTPEGTGYWNIDPQTYKWVKWSDSFGVFDLPGILPGFEGNYPIATTILGEFEAFFALATTLAERLDVDWKCDDNDANSDSYHDTLEALKKVDKEARKNILVNVKWEGLGERRVASPEETKPINGAIPK